METKFEIPVENLGALSEKFKKLNRKAKKLGCAPVTMKIGETISQNVVNEEGYTVQYKFSIVEVFGEAPKFSGWTFVSRLAFEHDTPTVWTVPGENLPTEYQHTDARCDHCGKTRSRKDVFVVRNEAGEHKQVGRQCLADFLGHNDPNVIAQHMSWIRNVYDEFGNAGEYGYAGITPAYGVDFIRFLTMVCAVVRTQGWVSASEAYNSGGNKTATKEIVWGHLHAKGSSLADMPKITEADKNLSGSVSEWVKSEISPRETKSDYEHNLSVAFEEAFVTYKDSGIVASAVSVYMKHMEQKINRAQSVNERNSTYIGKISERADFTLRLVKVTYIEGRFGSVHLCKFYDINGNVVVWFSSTEPDFELDKEYTLKATVKAHREYNGVKQTVINRAKVIN